MSSTTPYVVFQYSVDDGRTWSDENWIELVGSAKNYLTKVQIFGISSAEAIIFRLTHTEDAPFSIISGHADVSVAI